MSVVRHFVLAAGGTGGHMMPAHALAAELTARGHQVALVTDARGAKIPGLFEGVQTHIIPAGRITKNPLSWPGGLKAIWAGRSLSKRLYQSFRPSAVIGFGGYPAYPALVAAHAMGIPTAVHEQNAVLGRVNRMVASKVKAIATAYPDVERIPAGARGKVHLVGNPVREDIVALRDQPYPPLDEEGVFRVLVIGGSQGASILSEVVPNGLAMLPEALRRRLQVTQQCRAEDIESVRAQYKTLGIPADLATYMTDIPAKLAWTHLMIARAGASTISELTAAGRPAIFVPLPSAMDDHQTANVREMVAAGGAAVLTQPRITTEIIEGDSDRANKRRLARADAVERMRDLLVKQMQKLGLEPAGLAHAAEAAKSCGRPHATRDLANLVEQLGRPPVMDGVRAEDWGRGTAAAAAS